MLAVVASLTDGLSRFVVAVFFGLLADTGGIHFYSRALWCSCSSPTLSPLIGSCGANSCGADSHVLYGVHILCWHCPVEPGCNPSPPQNLSRCVRGDVPSPSPVHPPAHLCSPSLSLSRYYPTLLPTDRLSQPNATRITAHCVVAYRLPPAPRTVAALDALVIVRPLPSFSFFSFYCGNLLCSLPDARCTALLTHAAPRGTWSNLRALVSLSRYHHHATC